ncbi:hypothetical protein BKA82DRAFT_996940 [Pisolithus tinctorius]|uniref:Uncharacterized protein n=1 Tax=Pisolithus tinctorius Marx 270 TaxID=870435 RepID=A0A0C3KGH1_PISTI|nr:hypothetical protein BKA82DRAFT_996940 [Pisolithus tinctorius]KIO08697.1 hypothetical protein M404DRAFT_996940 [Pisolithus tinctorius Marx 270]
MRDLADARAELARLQHRELELVQELSDVRKDVAAQKVAIEVLIKSRAVPYINRLPNELLAQIFLLIKYRRASLADVLRRWQAVIMDTPGIWSWIDLDDYFRSRALRWDLERSRPVPLSVSVGRRMSELDDVLSHANRLRTLAIPGSTEKILKRLYLIKLPSLHHLFVTGGGLSVDPLLMTCSYAPALKHLELHKWKVPSHRALSQFIAAEPLEELSLVDVTASDDEFHSMHFPSLQRLALDIRLPMSFLDAIVAPKLAYFCFTANRFAKSLYGESIDESKFNNVSHLSFAATQYTGTVNVHALEISERLCHIFRGTRYATIHVNYVSTLFSDRGPVDLCWTFLESLEIQDITPRSIKPLECLLDWLRWRENSGQPKLHLKLVSRGPNANSLMTLNTSHRTLRECCASVVLDGVPTPSQMCLFTSSDSLSNPLDIFRCQY